MSRKQKRKNRNRRKRRSAVPARFVPGAEVRMRYGTVDPDYPDLPLGGWAGTITEVDRRGQQWLYCIRWNEQTVAAMHPTYVKRCLRDNAEHDVMWVAEQDVEPANGEHVPLEQPMRIVTRPLNLKNSADRIRAIFALTSDDPLPAIRRTSLEAYHAYLSAQLELPFSVWFHEITGVLEVTRHEATAMRLCSVDEADPDNGLYVEVQEGRVKEAWPLRDIEPIKAGKNRRLIENYASWFSDAETDWNPDDEAFDEFFAPDGQSRLRFIVQKTIPALIFLGLLGALVGSQVATMNHAALGAGLGAILLGVLGFCARPISVSVDSDTTTARESPPFSDRAVRALVWGVTGAALGIVVTGLCVVPLRLLSGIGLGLLLRASAYGIGKYVAYLDVGLLSCACSGILAVTLYALPESAGSRAFWGLLVGASIVPLSLAAAWVLGWCLRSK